MYISLLLNFGDPKNCWLVIFKCNISYHMTSSDKWYGLALLHGHWTALWTLNLGKIFMGGYILVIEYLQ